VTEYELESWRNFSVHLANLEKSPVDIGSPSDCSTHDVQEVTRQMREDLGSSLCLVAANPAHRLRPVSPANRGTTALFVHHSRTAVVDRR